MIEGQIVGVRRYAGDAAIESNMDVVREAVEVWTRAGSAAAAYAIDFGVLATGETALVELNDGYSLGAYGLPAEVYTDVILRRFRELIAVVA